MDKLPIAQASKIVLAADGQNGFVSTEVVNSTFVLRLSVRAKNPPTSPSPEPLAVMVGRTSRQQ